MTYYEYVNGRLWLMTEQPRGWRRALTDLERRFTK